MGEPCPSCGSRFTYMNSRELVCRNCQAHTPREQVGGGSSSAPAQQEGYRGPNLMDLINGNL